MSPASYRTAPPRKPRIAMHGTDDRCTAGQRSPRSVDVPGEPAARRHRPDEDGAVGGSGSSERRSTRNGRVPPLASRSARSPHDPISPDSAARQPAVYPMIGKLDSLDTKHGCRAASPDLPPRPRGRGTLHRDPVLDPRGDRDLDDQPDPDEDRRDRTEDDARRATGFSTTETGHDRGESQPGRDREQRERREQEPRRLCLGEHHVLGRERSTHRGRDDERRREPAAARRAERSRRARQTHEPEHPGG